MTLYRNLPALTQRFDNFAYFCKFDHYDRKKGMERLFLSNLPPLFEYGQANDFFDKLLASEEKSADFLVKFPVRQLPIFVSYDFIGTVFTGISYRKSDWPTVAAIIPEEIFYDTCDRKEDRLRAEIHDDAAFDSHLAEKIEKTMSRVYKGEALQVVISRRFEIDNANPFNILNHFIDHDQSLYVYYYKFGDYEIIGSSPENLISLEGQILRINPIAGTMPRGQNEIEDYALSQSLLVDEKELMEHRMLVDLARNDLGKISKPGSVRVTKSMELQKFASVQHLVSTVIGEKIEDVGVLDILKAVFPAGTVSGAPKKRAIQIIDEIEDGPRGAYAGAVGLAGADFLDLALLIRSIFSNAGSAYTQAGAGIVKDSHSDKEVKEIFSKAETVLGGLRNESVSH